MEHSLVLYKDFSAEFRKGNEISIDLDAEISAGDYVLNPETQDCFVVMGIKRFFLNQRFNKEFNVKLIGNSG